MLNLQRRLGSIMAADNQLALKGQACVLAAQNAYDLIKAKEDAEKAAKCLAALADDGKQLRRVAEENKEKSVAKEEELEKEIIRLTEERDGYDLTVSSLNDQKRNKEYERSQQEVAKSNAESDLRDAKAMLSDAQSELRRAKEKEKATMTTAVTTGVVVGLFTFGIGGLAAGAAVGAGIAALINETEGKVDRARDRIRNRESDISRAERGIQSIGQAISGITREIEEYRGRIANTQRSLNEVHQKIGENKPTMALHRTAMELWDLFAMASEDATGTTQQLESILEKANEEQNLKIVRSNGTIKIAKSVVEAWEEISFYQGRIASE